MKQYFFVCALALLIPVAGLASDQIEWDSGVPVGPIEEDTTGPAKPAGGTKEADSAGC